MPSPNDVVNPYASEICSIHTGPFENLPFQYGGEENTTDTIALLFPLPMSESESPKTTIFEADSSKEFLKTVIGKLSLTVVVPKLTSTEIS